jgi:signal transduction histidine kinase
MPIVLREPSNRADSFDRLPRGTHLCHLYRDQGELLAAAIPFILAGLRNRERCVWITSDPALAGRQLAGGNDELDHLFASGSIDIVHQRAWQADASRRWRDAIAAGHRGLRVAADMTCLGTDDGGQAIALCSYPIEVCTSGRVIDILHAHPKALVHDGAGWSYVDTGILWATEDALSMVSHELKTPLSSLRLRIDGLLRKLDAGGLDREEVCERLSKALEQCDRVDALVNNLLDVSRASYGRLQVLLEPCDLGATVRDTAERFGEEATHRGGTLTVAVDQIPGLWDRTRIEQVVTNLVSNALRHAPGAPVEVRARRQDGLALIEVRDQGPGIPADLVDNLFERFSVGPRMRGGLGIVREIASALGGSVVVASEPGRGAAFTVVLPHPVEETGLA